MTDFLFVVLLTALIAVTSLLIFVLCVRQVNTTFNFNIIEAFNEVNEVIRRLRVQWKRDRRGAALVSAVTFFYLYFKFKSRTALGSLDATLVSAMTAVLIAMSTIGIFDIVYECLLWLKASGLNKK